jgi:hypothetical protein
MRGVRQRKFRSIWGERVQEREKWWQIQNEERENRYWTEGEEGARCAVKRERRSSTCRMDGAK